MDNLSEIQIQAKVFKEIWNTYPETRNMLFHVPNGGSRNKIEGMQLKASGVIAGIPDILFIWNCILYAIEIKTTSGVLSDVQKKIHQIWRTNGINTYICYGYDETLKIITDIINGRNMETRYCTTSL